MIRVNMDLTVQLELDEDLELRLRTEDKALSDFTESLRSKLGARHLSVNGWDDDDDEHDEEWHIKREALVARILKRKAAV